MVEGEIVVARWTPRPEHHAFGNFLNGGIISTVLDCHSNWTAAYSLMMSSGGKSTLPPTVTASFCVRFLSPTPIGHPLVIEARPTQVREERGRRVIVVESCMKAEGRVTATLTGEFVAVGPTHPAALRWSQSPKKGT
jgi:acyl-coenzyme A thioesterase PaaI-like protein